MLRLGSKDSPFRQCNNYGPSQPPYICLLASLGQFDRLAYSNCNLSALNAAAMLSGTLLNGYTDWLTDPGGANQDTDVRFIVPL